MAADSASTSFENGWRHPSLTKKIFRRGEYLIGAAGSWAYLQALQHALDLPQPPKVISTYHDAEEFLIKNIIPILSEYLISLNDDCKDIAYEALITFNSYIFEIQQGIDVYSPPKGYLAIGCASQLAMGALYAMEAYDMSPEARLAIALDAAEAFNATVCKPYLVEVMKFK